MTRKIDVRLVSALLVGLLAFFTSWSAFAGANHKKAAAAVHARYLIHSLPSLAHSATGTRCATCPAMAAITITASQTDLQHRCV